MVALVPYTPPVRHKNIYKAGYGGPVWTRHEARWGELVRKARHKELHPEEDEKKAPKVPAKKPRVARWHEERRQRREDAIKRMFAAGMTMAQVANKQGVQSESLRQFCNKRGIKKPVPIKIQKNDKRNKMIFERYEELGGDSGCCIAEFARELKMASATLRRILFGDRRENGRRKHVPLARMKIGDSIFVAESEVVRTTLCRRAQTLWGNRSYKTSAVSRNGVHGTFLTYTGQKEKSK